MDNGEGRAIQKVGEAIRFDPLNPGANVIDLGSLSQEQQNQLLVEYMRGTLDINKKAAQMHVDVNAFKNMLDVMSTKTRELADQEGTSVTMQHTQETSVGRTEVIMGNTEQAASGKLTRTMAGDRNLTWLYAVGGAIVVLILVSMFLRH
ncbi:MAG: hypothetical protein ACREM6_07500 [Vulcanimicrobiaceae bacterium]